MFGNGRQPAFLKILSAVLGLGSCLILVSCASLPDTKPTAASIPATATPIPPTATPEPVSLPDFFQGVETLINRAQQPDMPVASLVLPTRLIVRDSSGANSEQ